MAMNTIFMVGDRVYFPYFGLGTVTTVCDRGGHPVKVTWGNGYATSFTAEGFLDYGDENDRLTVVEKASLKGEKEMEEDSKFKVGYRVSYPYHGLGTVIANHNDGRLYPIDVKWDKSPKGCEVSTFTKDGFLVVSLGDCGDNDKLTVVGNILSKEEETEEEAKDNVLKVGDRVWLNAVEKGTIVQFCPNEETCIVDSELDGEVEVVKAGLTKVEYSPINPSHYQVAGIPEAIDIMKHLMAQEQFKGFLWGNIIKYAYRYGRKGDEHDTAGKIEWYANRLKEVCAEEKKEQK